MPMESLPNIIFNPFLKSLGLLGLLLGAQWGEVARATVTPPPPSFNTAAAPVAQGSRPRTPASQPICQQQLAQSLDAIVNQPQFARARWGIVVETLRDGRVLYARDRDRYFLPASTAKLLTTAAALQTLGPQFQFRTTIRQAIDPTILQVVGSGDPSFTDTQLQSLAQQLRRRGIRQVRQLIGHDPDPRGATNPTWEWEDIQAGYGAPVNSLILNQNAVEFSLFPQQVGQPLRVQWTDAAEGQRWRVENRSRTVPPDTEEFVEVGRDLNTSTVYLEGQLQAGAPPETVAVAVVNPGQRFLQAFQQTLKANDIAVGQMGLTTAPPSPRAQAIAAVASPPLATLLIETNRESNNLYAESLRRAVEASVPVPASAVEAAPLTTSLSRLGVDPTGYTLMDGSGLSRHNLITPSALVQTLRGMHRTPNAAIYRASLAVAGQSGTLQNRFQNTPVQGILQGKTGSMNGVAALAGYLDPPGFQPLVFSLIVNQSDLPGSSLRQTLDQMVVQLARLRTC